MFFTDLETSLSNVLNAVSIVLFIIVCMDRCAIVFVRDYSEHGLGNCVIVYCSSYCWKIVHYCRAVLKIILSVIIHVAGRGKNDMLKTGNKKKLLFPDVKIEPTVTWTTERL